MPFHQAHTLALGVRDNVNSDSKTHGPFFCSSMFCNVPLLLKKKKEKESK